MDTFTDAFKKEVAIEALRERTTQDEIAAKHGIPSSLVSAWKEAFIAGDLFGEITRLKGEIAERTRQIEKVKEELEKSKQEQALLLKKMKN